MKACRVYSLRSRNSGPTPPTPCIPTGPGPGHASRVSTSVTEAKTRSVELSRSSDCRSTSKSEQLGKKIWQKSVQPLHIDGTFIESLQFEACFSRRSSGEHQANDLCALVLHRVRFPSPKPTCAASEHETLKPTKPPRQRVLNPSARQNNRSGMQKASTGKQTFSQLVLVDQMSR